MCGSQSSVISAAKELEGMKGFFMSIPTDVQSKLLPDDFFEKPRLEQDNFWTRILQTRVFSLHSSRMQSPVVLECGHSVESFKITSNTQLLCFSKWFPFRCLYTVGKVKQCVKILSTKKMKKEDSHDDDIGILGVEDGVWEIGICRRNQKKGLFCVG